MVNGMVAEEFYSMADDIDGILKDYYPGFLCSVNKIELNDNNVLTIKVNIYNNRKVEERT